MWKFSGVIVIAAPYVLIGQGFTFKSDQCEGNWTVGSWFLHFQRRVCKHHAPKMSAAASSGFYCWNALLHLQLRVLQDGYHLPFLNARLPLLTLIFVPYLSNSKMLDLDEKITFMLKGVVKKIWRPVIDLRHLKIHLRRSLSDDVYTREYPLLMWTWGKHTCTSLFSSLHMTETGVLSYGPLASVFTQPSRSSPGLWCLWLPMHIVWVFITGATSMTG